MTNSEIRHLLSEALEYASVPGFADSPRQTAFCEGADVRMDELQIDSLASMELCIAIETNLDVTILPADLAEIGSLGALVEHIERLKYAKLL